MFFSINGFDEKPCRHKTSEKKINVGAIFTLILIVKVTLACLQDLRTLVFNIFLGTALIVNYPIYFMDQRISRNSV